MRQREHNASNEGDNDSDGSERRALFPNACEAAATALQSSAGDCRHAATGVAPRCNLTRESAGLQTDSNCDTTESNAEQPIMRGRVLPDKHSHGLSEPRAKQPVQSYKADTALSGG